MIQLEVLSHRPEGPRHGPPLLLVHGMWHAAWCWEEHFLPYFAAQGFEAHALSLRGHGNSASVGSLRWTSIAHYVEDVAQVAAELDEAPVVVGHSMGGMVVQHYLTRYSAPAAVLLASVPHSGALRATLRFCARHPLRFLRANLSLSMWPVISDPAVAREALFSVAMPDEEVQRHHARLQDESYRAYLGLVALELPRGPLRTKRLLVMGAEEDFFFPPAAVKATADHYKAPCEIVAGAAHDLMLEPQWQAAADSIIAWLKQA